MVPAEATWADPVSGTGESAGRVAYAGRRSGNPRNPAGVVELRRQSRCGVGVSNLARSGAKTSAKDQEGLIIPVVITIYSDRSFTFITKTPPVPVLIKRAVSIAKGSAEPHKTKVGKITQEQVKEIAKIKMPDLNCFDLEAAMRSVAGTARSMGVDVV